MFRDKIREILELVLKAEEKNIYVAYNYDTNTKTLTIITKTKVFGTEIPMSVRASDVSVEGGSTSGKYGNGTGKSTFVNLLTGFADINIFGSHIE